MYSIIDFCCICFCNKEHLQHLSDSDRDNLTYLTKLTSCVSEMCFNEINEQWLVCNKCCETMDAAYKFRQRCLRSKATLTDYISQLHKVSNKNDAINIYITDINNFCILQKNYRKGNAIIKTKMIINETENVTVKESSEINTENSTFTSKLIETGNNYNEFENVVVKMELDDQYFEENVQRNLDNPLINQNESKLVTSATKKEIGDQNNDEYLQNRSCNIKEISNNENDNTEIIFQENCDPLYLEKCFDGPPTNLDDIKIDIEDNDIKSVKREINNQYTSADIEDLLKEDEDKTDNVWKTSPKRKTLVSPGRSTKNRRKAINLDMKMKIIHEHEAGKKVKAIAREFGLAHSTVSTILKDRERIKEAVKISTGSKAIITRQRKGLIHEMEKLLVVWFDDQIEKGIPTSLVIIQAKARSIFEKLKAREDEESTETFTASHGWFQRFRRRFNLQNRNIRSEANVDLLSSPLSTSTTTPDNFSDSS